MGDPSDSGKGSEPADRLNPPTGEYLSKEFQYSNTYNWNQIRRGTLIAVNNVDNVDGLGSQFFLALSDEHQSILGDDSKYTVMGVLVDGIEAIEKLEDDKDLNNKEKMKKNGKPRGKWKKENWIRNVEIHNNPFTEH